MMLALAQRSSRQGVRCWKLCKDTVAPCRFVDLGRNEKRLQIPMSHGPCPAREEGSWCCAPHPGRFNPETPTTTEAQRQSPHAKSWA
eukprot:s4745_g7.t1